jgi:2-oxoglutarate dehydrogenase E2 component (dihydrolipoamide succinyltransferase)
MKVVKPTPAPAPRGAAAKPATPGAVGTSTEILEAKEPPTRVTGTRLEIKVKMNRMRLRIAQRLKDAQNTNAMLTTFNEVDMSGLMNMRKQYNDVFFKQHSVKLGFMSPFVKASATALQQMPTVNAVIEDAYTIYRDFVDISIAVATPKGLVVPVLRNVNAMNFADIELGMADLGKRAREGALAVEDMDGGTFTISNGGVFGSLMGTPIINPPQSAILGMHGIFERPVAINGKVEVRPMMYVALTYDHRLIDGREAVTFLRKIKQNVEDPTSMLLDI